ncbi:transcription factor bHLH118-like [Coffea arabica]|uniref:Transcription factor bHLH118-like n=1 Tax=Coffea arabica TaxID=13443 RepID=A0ABM4X0H6_COFAR
MDDFTKYMFPLQHDEILSFAPIPIIHPYLDPTIHHQDLENQGASSLASHQQNTEEIVINNHVNKAWKSQRKPASAIRDDQNVKGRNPEQKRAFHRDIERQRRLEMANLHASLRNLLPSEYIKGKRSMSDHVLEAINYIKHMEKNIGELEVKRDKLRNLTGESSNLDSKRVNETNSLSITFTVEPCSGGGFEILMKNYLTDNNWLPLSRILDVLLDEGITVVNCVCTKVNEECLYTIQTEATHMSDVDLISLQVKLTEKFMACKKLWVVEQH